MSLADRENPELAELLDGLVDGTLTDEQKTRLSQILAASEQARELYVRYLGLSASLFEYAGELQFPSTTPQSAAAPRIRKSRFWWRLPGWQPPQQL